MGTDQSHSLCPSSIFLFADIKRKRDSTLQSPSQLECFVLPFHLDTLPYSIYILIASCFGLMHNTIQDRPALTVATFAGSSNSRSISFPSNRLGSS